MDLTTNISQIGEKNKFDKDTLLIYFPNDFYFDQTDLFAVELLNGHIYVHIDLGSGSTKIRASKRRVDDGVWHDFSVRRNQRDVRAAVDGSNVDFKTTGKI